MTDQPLQFGKYQILATLGQGDFDVVHRARDMALERTVALKVLALHLMADPAFAAQFAQEARLAARLTHPHIVTVYDVGRHFIAMKNNE
jgi:serine/threonine-protein kinase